jgi:hypothetical protein
VWQVGCLTRDQRGHPVRLAVANVDRKAFLLRLSPELWKELERWAADDLRSINAQIEFLLRQAVQRRKGATRIKED